MAFMKPQLTPFACVSKAYSTNASRQPVAGIVNLARVAHKHRVPVTWILTESAARDLRSELAEWHREFGDEVAVALVHLEQNADAYRRRREKIQECCSWSKVEIAGIGGGKSTQMLAALQQTGFRGLWGYCWEQIYVDGITDFGQPPGMFRASKKSYKMPSSDDDGIIAIEWISRDLNKAFWTSNPVHFSVESDAFLVMGDWPWDVTLEYYDHVLAEYQRNARAGHPIPLIFQEEAEQLAPGLVNETYDAVYAKMLEWLDAAFARTPRDGVEFTTMPALVDQFTAKPQLVRARDKAFPSLRKERRPIFGAEFCFPEVAHYSDARRYATFITGNPSPIRLIRYDRQQAVDVKTPLLPESRMPRLLELHRTPTGWRARVQSEETCPFALALPNHERESRVGCVANGDVLVWPLDADAGVHWYER